MRRSLISIGLVVALAAVAGCKKDKKKTDADEGKAPTAETPPPETPPETPPPETPPPEDPSKPTMANKMMHCPSAAPGATTTVKADKTSVTVTVVAKDAKDKAAIAEIQKRSKHLSTLDTSADADVKHTGEGTGGGQLGQCPVVMTDVTLKVKDSKTGSAVTMTPKDKAKVADLEKMAKERAESMPAMDAAAGGGDAAGGAGGEPPKEEPAGKGDDAKGDDAK